MRLTVVSQSGKEATVGILNVGDFFGEVALAGQPRRMGSASAITDCNLLRIEKTAMMRALHQQHAFSDLFVAYLQELRSASSGSALEIPLAEIAGIGLANLRSAVHRASTSAGLSIETLADEKNFYMWTKPSLK